MSDSQDTADARIQRLEALMLDLVEGRIRTDFIFGQLEHRGLIPNGILELGRKVTERHRLRVDRRNCSPEVIGRGVLSMQYGAKAQELDDEIARADKEILDLTRKLYEEASRE
jgi:hypothetical protein